MNLKVIDKNFSICKVNSIDDISYIDEYCFVAKTDNEISLVCEYSSVPEKFIECENGWKAFRIEGVLEFSLIGILYKISEVLAKNNIGIFAVSTYNTDYIFVKEHNFHNAVEALEKEGYNFV